MPRIVELRIYETTDDLEAHAASQDIAGMITLYNGEERIALLPEGKPLPVTVNVYEVGAERDMALAERYAAHQHKPVRRVRVREMFVEITGGPVEQRFTAAVLAEA
jgi:hypothetical protein